MPQKSPSPGLKDIAKHPRLAASAAASSGKAPFPPEPSTQPGKIGDQHGWRQYRRTHEPMPAEAWRALPHELRGSVQPRLVAQSAEPQHPSPALGGVEPDAARLQL